MDFNIRRLIREQAADISKETGCEFWIVLYVIGHLYSAVIVFGAIAVNYIISFLL